MFGADCAFAHGTVELRRPRVEDGRMCYNFMYKGTCYCGENCIFSHASAAPGLAIRNPWELMPVEARRSETTPSVTVRSETSSASGRAFPPAVHQVPQEQEAAGGRRISNLERLSRKKTTGIYGDWPEQF
ncbi:zinc finger CCCH domain-containing protein 1 [Brachypodium distachyon]|nr:zinc finger CCCH domain-containing protein 1 [Brachypodium distachyon]|eukprot:XP_010232992.1 zinc finger CCCH domain-containing protein 1 [Brachypodium distachyon]